MIKKSYGLFCNEKFVSPGGCECPVPLLIATSVSKADITQIMIKLEALHHWVAIEEQRNIRKDIKESVGQIIKRASYKYRDVSGLYPLASSGEELNLLPALGASFFYLKEVPAI